MNIFDNYARSTSLNAGPVAMTAWALAHAAQRPPDVTLVIKGVPYLRRWFVIPRNDVVNVYLHNFVGSDEPRALHDHRGDNVSWLLDGEYLEHTPDGILLRRAGERIERKAADVHRVELIDNKPVWSLFIIGPIVRDWGFLTTEGWLHWEEFNRRYNPVE